MMKYVLIVAGQAHVSSLNLCLKFLKKYTKQEIVVLAVRAEKIEHDNVVSLNSDLNDLSASRYLKTFLPHLVDGLCCYLDNDVLAVHEEIDTIFQQFKSPVTFGTDHIATVEIFSPWAVLQGSLEDAIYRKFGIKVDPCWSLWNGGVFLFDRGSTEFMDCWHDYAMSVIADPSWISRDQGALVATVFKFGLQNHPRFSHEYNWIVQHSGLADGQFSTEFDGSRFRYRDKQIKFMHFIKKGLEGDRLEFIQAQNIVML